MYLFKIAKDERGEWRFELDGIYVLLDDFFIKDEKHYITNPAKAIAYFNIDGLLYGIMNDIKTYHTVEDFYDAMKQQYMIFMAGIDKKAPKIYLKNNDDSLRKAI